MTPRRPARSAPCASSSEGATASREGCERRAARSTTTRAETTRCRSRSKRAAARLVVCDPPCDERERSFECGGALAPGSSPAQSEADARRLRSTAARFPTLVPGLDFKSSVKRLATFQAGSIPVPRRHRAAASPAPRRPSRPLAHRRPIRRRICPRVGGADWTPVREGVTSRVDPGMGPGTRRVVGCNSLHGPAGPTWRCARWVRRKAAEMSAW